MLGSSVLVTGATGFIGSHLVRGLIQNHYHVIILKRKSSDIWRLEDVLPSIRSYDLEEGILDKIFEDNEIEAVAHLATFYKKNDDHRDILPMSQTNVALPFAMLSLLEKYGVKGFLNTGTFFEYDCSNQPVSEINTEHGFNNYAKLKLAFETILRSYSSSLCINTLRLFSPFGSKDNPKLIPSLIKSGINGSLTHLSDGYQKLDFIHVDDIVDAFLKSLKRMESNCFSPEYEVFNIGSGHALSIRDLVKIIEDELECGLNVVWGEPSLDGMPSITANIDKAKSLLDWTPNLGIRQGLSKTIQYYKDHQR